MKWNHKTRVAELTFGVAIALTVLAQAPPLAAASTNPLVMLKVDEQGISPDLRARTSFAPVIKKVSPSIVNIYSTMTIRGGGQMRNPFLEDPFLRRFFGGDDNDENPRPRARKAQSLGSGVIVSANGYILTANHVVEGADKVKVSLGGGDGTEFDAKVIGTDPPTDVAVLKIEGKDLPAITITDSDKLEVGDTVLAVGNPFDVGRTVTMGIVSATSRGGFGINAYEDFIQTDAAINPGNSGGALVDAEGRLVGINTAILSGSGGFQGVGFAVPINLARYVTDQIIKEGKVSRGYLGVHLEPNLTPALAKKFNLPNVSGALVAEVEPSSPAAKAGFKEGDFVTEVNDKKVSDMRLFRLMVAQMAPGTKIDVKILRDGKERTLSVVLGKMPDDMFTRNQRQRQTPREGGEGVDALDGVEVVDLDSRTKRQLGIPANVQGALVSAVDPDSNAADAGLSQGDVIVEIDRRPVTSAQVAVDLSDKSKADQILLRVWTPRGGGMHYLTVDNRKRK
jgi:serine protease Do